MQQFYNNLANAKMLGMKSTGNGFRPNLKIYPTPTLINLIVEPGEESFSNLIKKLDQCIIIDLALGKKNLTIKFLKKMAIFLWDILFFLIMRK